MDELAKRFADLAAKYGPSVADAAKAAAQTNAYSCLMAGTLAIAIGGFLVWVGLWVHRQEDWEEEWVLASIAAWIVGGIAIWAGAWQWLDPWTWTSISHPELWLAKQAFHI